MIVSGSGTRDSPIAIDDDSEDEVISELVNVTSPYSTPNTLSPRPGTLLAELPPHHLSSEVARNLEQFREKLQLQVKKRKRGATSLHEDHDDNAGQKLNPLRLPLEDRLSEVKPGSNKRAKKRRKKEREAAKAEAYMQKTKPNNPGSDHRSSNEQGRYAILSSSSVDGVPRAISLPTNSVNTRRPHPSDRLASTVDTSLNYPISAYRPQFAHVSPTTIPYSETQSAPKSTWLTSPILEQQNCVAQPAGSYSVPFFGPASQMNQPCIQPMPLVGSGMVFPPAFNPLAFPPTIPMLLANATSATYQQPPHIQFPVPTRQPSTSLYMKKHHINQHEPPALQNATYSLPLEPQSQPQPQSQSLRLKPQSQPQPQPQSKHAPTPPSATTHVPIGKLDSANKHGFFPIPAGVGPVPKKLYSPILGRTLVMEHIPKALCNISWIKSWSRKACGSAPQYILLGVQTALMEYQSTELAVKAWGSQRLGTDESGKQLEGFGGEYHIALYPYKRNAAEEALLLKKWKMDNLEEGEISSAITVYPPPNETKKERKARLAKEGGERPPQMEGIDDMRVTKNEKLRAGKEREGKEQQERNPTGAGPERNENDRRDAEERQERERQLREQAVKEELDNRRRSEQENKEARQRKKGKQELLAGLNQQEVLKRVAISQQRLQGISPLLPHQPAQPAPRNAPPSTHQPLPQEALRNLIISESSSSLSISKSSPSLAKAPYSQSLTMDFEMAVASPSSTTLRPPPSKTSFLSPRPSPALVPVPPTDKSPLSAISQGAVDTNISSTPAIAPGIELVPFHDKDNDVREPEKPPDPPAIEKRDLIPKLELEERLTQAGEELTYRGRSRMSMNSSISSDMSISSAGDSQKTEVADNKARAGTSQTIAVNEESFVAEFRKTGQVQWVSVLHSGPADGFDTCIAEGLHTLPSPLNSQLSLDPGQPLNTTTPIASSKHSELAPLTLPNDKENLGQTTTILSGSSVPVSMAEQLPPDDMEVSPPFDGSESVVLQVKSERSVRTQVPDPVGSVLGTTGLRLQHQQRSSGSIAPRTSLLAPSQVSSTLWSTKQTLAEKQRLLEQEIEATKALMAKMARAQTKQEREKLMTILREKSRVMDEFSNSIKNETLVSTGRYSQQTKRWLRIRWPETREDAGVLVISDDEDEAD